MSFRFLRPVLHGDAVTCTLRIVSVNDKGFTRAEAVMVNQDGAEVLHATLEGFLPVDSDRRVLARMVADGDPTNGRRGER
jgi:acyl dehydratase